MKNISKRVVALDTVKIVGYILDVCIDETIMCKVGYYVVEEESESEFLIVNEDIVAIGENTIFIESQEKLQFIMEKKNSLLGKLVFDFLGNEYGIVENLVFEKNRLVKVSTQKCEVMSKFLNKVGDDCLLVSTKKKRFGDAKKIFTKQNFDTLVRIQGNGISVPQKINLSSNYYIGKVAKCDVFGFNNERVVSKGDKITKTIFENVKKHNKLNELFFVINN